MPGALGKACACFRASLRLLSPHGGVRRSTRVGPEERFTMRPSNRAPDELRPVTLERTRREVNSGKPSGRTQEIQRLIGRSLRAVVNLPAMGERQIVIDCDVIQADGGTRTASVTGAWVALHECFTWMQGRSIISVNPLREPVAAISCGIYQGTPVLDLDYAEDSAAETDSNFVITGSGGIVEVQGTAEGKPFSEEEFLNLLRLAKAGVAQLVDLQKKAVA